MNKFKKTCFFCKYEISKHNKSKNFVKFRNKLKPLCRYCTKNKHKPLEPKNKDNDTHCKICNKAVMYKKCIACSICDHFFHGKCLNLSKDDIKNIENICDFFICQLCNNDMFPKQVLFNEKPDLKGKKSKSNQCFTCNNVILKDKYPNKFLMYNDKRQCVCKECSYLNKDIPVRDKSLIEFLDCSICKHQVKYESIFCNLCQHWVHPYCNKITKKELKQLSEVTANWHCYNCNLEIFPNNLIEKSDSTCKTKSSNSIKNEYATKDNCSVCSKKVTGTETLACSTCKHWLHKKCIGHFNTRAEYQNFLKYYSNKEWDCPVCTADILPFISLDNDEFYMLLLEMYTEPIYLNKENFQQIYIKMKDVDFFSELDDNDSKESRYLNDIDPDSNYHSKDSCKYAIETSKIVTKSSKELTMVTFNIRSIKKNFKSFVNLLKTFTFKMHVICLTETWLGPLDNTDDFKLEGYHPPHYQNRIGNMHGGGVITYVHKNISKQKLVKSMSYVDEFNHCLATEITINNKITTFLNVYRSPNNLNESFLDKFETIVERNKSRICYILGDMNYNLINLDKHDATRNYYNILTSSSFKPLITKPTRITDNSKTLIDHIWTNDLRNSSVHHSHIVITDITDHLPCFTFVANPDILIKGYKTITKRVINDANRDQFMNRISEIRGALSFHTNNTHQTSLQHKYDDYFFHLSKVYDECFPLITKKVHVKTLSKPWITLEVQDLIEKKNIRFSKKSKNNNNKNKKKYRDAKIKMEEAIDREKEKYYKNLLDNTNNSIQKKWDAIRIIINRKKVEQNDCPIPNNILGEHYASVAKNLAAKLPSILQDDIPTTSKSYNNAKSHLQNQFHFTPINEREVYELILKLDPVKGPGIDNLDVKSLKSISHIISPHLTSLFNQSLVQGVYPQCFKVAKCIPVFKRYPLDPSLPMNYRPISILTAINKVFERIIHNQLAIFLEENKLLPNFQYGYRKQHSTSQAILDFTDHVSKAQHNKMVTIAIFMDLSKAFDTVDKNILKQKLKNLGMSDMTSSLIDSYMSNRKFYMNKETCQYNLTHGVPQGSILGPLLFIMYTHDMVDITHENKVIVYADDTTVLVQGRNLTEAKQHSNDILTRFHHYFTLNKLSINPSKTKYMIYRPSYRRHMYKKLLIDTTNTKIKMVDTILEQVNSIKFLGVIINDKLSWESHKKQVYNKVCKTLGLIYRCKEVMDENNLIGMYKTFIQPYFLYGIEVWGHSVQSEHDLLMKLQSKVIRIIFDCKRSEDAWKHNNSKISSIKELYSNVINRLCFKHHAGLLPSYFCENIMPEFNIVQLQNKVTRITLDQMYNYKNTLSSMNTKLKASCVKTWNVLSLDTKSLPYSSKNKVSFKKFKI